MTRKTKIRTILATLIVATLLGAYLVVARSGPPPREPGSEATSGFVH